ncbi:fibropellin-1-like [Patiria miniata]|uniref:Delta-like protein n=1 Tax=Patiria miniata TaxID=46514 RepID=A0A914BN97_PATMI|nr:fibropellin-1-like [Patiria miniata]
MEGIVKLAFVFQAVLILQIFFPARPDATLEFRCQSFKKLGSECCDGTFFCTSECDAEFLVCLDSDYSSGSTDFNVCGLGRIDTDVVFDDKDTFDFPAVIPNNIDNPQINANVNWKGGMRVKYRATDDDLFGSDQIDEDFQSITVGAASSVSSAVWHDYTLKASNSEFLYKLRIYCNKDYYSSDCSVKCVPRDDDKGHYNCNQTTGAMVCHAGWQGTDCDVDVDECASGPCQHGGTCQNELNRFTCTCADGWSGSECEIDVNECESTPCKNGATCNDFIDYFNCSCVPGYVYADELCEIDDCAFNPCLNGSTCNDLPGNFSCTCTPGFECLCVDGYYGDFCEVDIDYCINQTCANNGTCVDRLDGFHCLCERGYEGPMCETNIDDCASNPCMYNSTCHDMVAEYICLCQDGYEGVNCHHETDECLGNPCMNNATCVDSIAMFSCQCLPGYQGVICDINTDECASHPCYGNETCVDLIDGYRCNNINECDSSPCVNGTCVDLVNEFTCHCSPGFDGPLCDVDTNECISAPCWYGTCVDEVNGFSCLCTVGYEGSVCQFEIDECESSPCLMNGTCLDLIDAFSCHCPHGYEGVHCESETDECASSPCVYGDCVDLPNAFSCECSPGYEGILCDQNTDECASAPCLHGKCVDEVNGYKCLCEVECVNGECDNGLCKCNTGYEGDDCSVQIDYCLSSPCNRGTCIPLLNAYRCECDELHTGTHCTDTIADPCSLSPCQNGECVPSSAVTDGYTCTCDEGYYGPTCNIDLLEYGSVIMLVGKITDTRDLEFRMAALLGKLMATDRRRASTYFTVDIVKTEDYAKSDSGETLTRVTYVSETTTGYLPKSQVEKTIEDTSPSTLKKELGYDVYTGKAEPRPPAEDNPDWIATNWYILVIAGVVVVAVASVTGIVIWQKRRPSSSRGSDDTGLVGGGQQTVKKTLRRFSRSNHFTRMVGDDAGQLTGTRVENPLYDPGDDEGFADEYGGMEFVFKVNDAATHGFDC